MFNNCEIPPDTHRIALFQEMINSKAYEKNSYYSMTRRENVVREKRKQIKAISYSILTKKEARMTSVFR
jgi:hypothetical protein